MTEIVPGVFLGNINDAHDIDFLSKNNITAILNMAREIPNAQLVTTYKHIPLDDSHNENIHKYFEEAIQFIQNAQSRGQRVLIHCFAGISRSATIVIAYIMKIYCWNFTTAYQYVKSKRPIVDPNFGFVCQLNSYEDVSCK